MYSTVCANTRHDATTLEVDDMIWNIKNLIYTRHDFNETE